MTPHYRGLLGNRQLGVGAVDVQAPNVETGEQVADRIKAHRWLTPEQTIITSSCGFNHLPRHIALGKLRAMREAKAILSGWRHSAMAQSEPLPNSSFPCAWERAMQVPRR